MQLQIQIQIQKKYKYKYKYKYRNIPPNLDMAPLVTFKSSGADNKYRNTNIGRLDLDMTPRVT